MNIRRKITAFVCLLILAMPMTYLIGLQLKQLHVRYEMKERLEDEQLHTIMIPVSEMVWVKKDKEVRIGDQLFDIKHWHVENGNAVLTGLYDHEERSIEKQLSRFGADETGKQAARIITMMDSQQAIIDAVNELTPIANPHYSFPFQYSSPLCTTTLPVLGPPPQS